MTSTSPAASSSDKSLKDLTVVELKDLCKERGIKGFAHKSKARLLAMIEAAPKTSSQSVATSPADTSHRSGPSKSAVKKKSKDKTTNQHGKGRQGDLTSLTIAQLKQFCKDQGIKGFARKNKQELLGLINSTTSSESSNRQSEIDVEEKKSSDSLNMENSPMDESDSNLLSSEDLDANQVDQEESADELSSAELDAVTEDLEGGFNGDAEETMVEVSDSLILEVLDRFDRIETLLQRIAEGLATSSGNP